ncbi:somatostatin receptor type 5 [Maylandia zebra]|uniref:Somatostatin receptor 5 n=1 Tax=Maylandia zebra TaxID=106582 RepID=A0A3P9BZ03_9CICH|nr:somatostatin receptor type 5 isoform X1 [Maylandia zebra]
MEDYSGIFENVSISSTYNFTADSFSNTTMLLPFNKVIVIIHTIVFIVGFLGNTLAIYVMARYAKMNTATNIYILNLAVADELYILGIPFIGTNSVLSYWPFGEAVCKISMTADAMSQFASTFSLTLMSIDRFLFVVYPVRSVKWRKPRLAKITSCIVWVVSFLIVLPVIIFSSVQEDFKTCNMSWPEPHDVWSAVFILYTSILSFFGPLIVVCLCYLFIVIKVRSARERAGLTKRRKSERKVTRMVVIIVLVFVFCWLPFYTTNIVNLIHIIPEHSMDIYFSVVILTYVNSCANPFLYAFLSKNFKESFQKVLCFQKANVARAAQVLQGRQNDTKSVQLKDLRTAHSEPLSTKNVVNGQ